MKRYTLLILSLWNFCFCANSWAQAEPAFLILPTTTAMEVRLVSKVESTDVNEGQSVDFEVIYPIVAENEPSVAIIKHKATAVGKIRRNDGDHLIISLEYVKAINDVNIAIRGELKVARQRRRGYIEVAEGTQLTAYTIEPKKIWLSTKR